MSYINQFDQEDIVNADLSGTYSMDENEYKEKSRLWERGNEYKKLNNAEISCTLKHIEAIKNCATGKNDISLIVEDDIFTFKKNYKKRLLDVIIKKEDWDLLFIGEGISKKFIMNKLNKKFILREKYFNVDHPATNCAEAYFIKKKAATKIYKNILPFNMISDWELAYQIKHLDLKVKWLFPPIFYQGSKKGIYKSELR